MAPFISQVVNLTLQLGQQDRKRTLKKWTGPSVCVWRLMSNFLMSTLDLEKGRTYDSNNWVAGQSLRLLC